MRSRSAELLGEMLAADEEVLEGVDDSSGEVGDAMRRVVDGVSSVIIGANDWAGAWAEVEDRDPRALADLVMRAQKANDVGRSTRSCALQRRS